MTAIPIGVPTGEVIVALLAVAVYVGVVVLVVRRIRRRKGRQR